MGMFGSPGRRKYECSEWTRPRSTVRPAAMRAWAATWPPKTRWRFSSGLTPRKMLTSMGSMSRSLTRKSRASLTAPSSQAPITNRRFSPVYSETERLDWSDAGVRRAAHQAVPHAFGKADVPLHHGVGHLDVHLVR